MTKLETRGAPPIAPAAGEPTHESRITNHRAAQPWHREPWVWFLIAPPAAAVLAGAVTVWLAVTTADGLVADDYYRRGLAIDRELRRDRAAAERGVFADITSRDGTMRVRLGGRAGDPEALFAMLVHATRAGHDERLRLARVAPGLYETELPALPPGRWRIILEDSRSEWRIVKEGP